MGLQEVGDELRCDKDARRHGRCMIGCTLQTVDEKYGLTLVIKASLKQA